MNIVKTAYEKALHYFQTSDGKEIDNQALAFAIVALEKQVPKKPKRTGHIIYDIFGHGQEFCVCPASSCRRFIFQNETSHGKNDIPYCKWCGQAIDWDR